MNVLAIGAHPDDLDISCGGTLLRFAQRGDRVTMCVMTDGRAYPVGSPEKVAARRRSEEQRSADLVGAELAWMGFHDGRLMDDIPTRLAMIELYMRVQPDLIITHAPDDYHADHNTTSRLATFTIQMAWAPPPELLDKGEPVRKPVPVAFMPPSNGINFLPEEYVDVSEVWNTKIQMALSHRSQYLPGPDYDSVELREPYDQYYHARMTRVVDEFYGAQCWSRYAEAFRWWRASDRLLPKRMLP
jgi:LmbE family N-acetylglucosaminyl deacetylase